MGYALLIIKPLTVGRGEAPALLEKILFKFPLRLRYFRNWAICDTTLWALSQTSADDKIVYEHEKIHAARHAPSWICLFESVNETDDPHSILSSYVGSLQGEFGRKSDHPSDTVIYLAPPERVNKESELLLIGFKRDDVVIGEKG